MSPQTVPQIPALEEQPVCILFKNHHEKYSKNKLSWSDLKRMVKNPLTMTKNDAACIASHLSGYKTKKSVETHNSMTLLGQDIDDGDLSLDELKQKLAMLGITSYIIYSTASSMRLDNKTGKVNGKKWRVLIQLAKPIDCATWLILQKALVNLLNGDEAAMRVQQILYVPNNAPIGSNHHEQS